MGLIVKKKSGSDGLMGLWQIDEKECALFDLSILSEAEKEQLARIGDAGKKMQWIAVRMLLAEMTGKRCEIFYDINNKPHLSHGLPFISISHSFDKVAVMLQKDLHTGIDIERVLPRIERIAAKFMNEKEWKYLSEEHRLEALYVHWCAKEALYKLYGKKGLLFSEQLIIQPFIFKDPGCITGTILEKSMNSSYELCYEKNGEHMVVYVSYN